MSVTPSSALVDAPFDVHVSGAKPGTPVTLEVSGARSHLGKVWRSSRVVRTDRNGEADLRDEYLLAELRPVGKAVSDDYLLWTQSLTITARAGAATATARATRLRTFPSVSFQADRPARTGFYGDWYVPRNRRPWFRPDRPAILLLGGSNGGAPSVLGSLLAAHGFPTLALAYFREPGLPQELKRIPLEYFQRALEWMAAQPEVDPKRIVTFGISRGGELSLLLASTYPDLVHGAVGYVSSNWANPSVTGSSAAWTLKGKEVLGPIPVERIRGPVFVVGAGKDALWPSAFNVRSILEDMQAAGRNDVTALLYGRAGHRVGSVVPNQPELSTKVNSIYGQVDMGGSPAADEAAREDSWPKLLRFLGHL